MSTQTEKGIQRLIGLFNARELQYQKGTGKVLDIVPNFIDAAEKTIDIEANESVEWREAHLSEYGIMSLVGIVTFNIGETLMSELGETIVVSEENQDKFLRVVRVGAPVDLIVEGTSEEIAVFLEEASLKHDNNQALAENIVDAMQGALREDPEGIDEVTMFAADEEFDIEALTDDQVDSMIMNEATSKGKIH